MDKPCRHETQDWAVTYQGGKEMWTGTCHSCGAVLDNTRKSEGVSYWLRDGRWFLDPEGRRESPGPFAAPASEIDQWVGQQYG